MKKILRRRAKKLAKEKANMRATRIGSRIGKESGKICKNEMQKVGKVARQLNKNENHRQQIRHKAIKEGKEAKQNGRMANDIKNHS